MTQRRLVVKNVILSDRRERRIPRIAAVQPPCWGFFIIIPFGYFAPLRSERHGEPVSLIRQAFIPLICRFAVGLLNFLE